MTVSPDLVLVFGPRGLLSLVGIVLIVGGVWRKCWKRRTDSTRVMAASSCIALRKKPFTMPQLASIPIILTRILSDCRCGSFMGRDGRGSLQASVVEQQL
jgi:hypothetical protein